MRFSRFFSEIDNEGGTTAGLPDFGGKRGGDNRLLHSRGKYLVIGLCLLTGWALRAQAQEGVLRAGEGRETVAGERPAETSPRGVQEIGPPVYLEDKDGKLQPVLGFTYEDFAELMKLKLQLTHPDQRPRYSIQRLEIQAAARDEHAELQVHYRIQVRDDNWVRVPLRLERALLTESAQYRGSGEQSLQFESDGEGYVSWIRGKPEQQHEIVLRALVPLGQLKDETRLKLTLPRATSSELKLTVPVAGAAARVSERATLQQAVAAADGATEFTVLGIGGDFEMAWHKPTEAGDPSQVVLEASASVLTRLDSRGITAEANLNVRSLGAPIDRFQVHLPAGSDLVPATAPGYQVASVTRLESSSSPATVEVQLVKKTSGPVDVRLATYRPIDIESEQWMELTGFEVVGAARQWGTMAVAAPTDWQVLWGPNRGVRQTDQVPEVLKHDDVAGAFEYFAQPYSLSAKLVAKKTRIHVEPSYHLIVSAEEATLEARLKYNLRGARVSWLDVSLAGWEWQDVGPENLVAFDGTTANDAGMLTIPLVQPMSGPIEIVLRARQAIPKGATTFKVSLPQPVANSSAPAPLVVSAAENVQLIPDAAASTGLTRESSPPEPASAGPSLAYRTESPEATFASALEVHHREVAVDLSSRILLGTGNARVEQTFEYRFAYVPTEIVELDVPRSLPAAAISFAWNGQPISAAAVNTPSDVGPARMQITLPGPTLGSSKLSVGFSVPLPTLTAVRRAMITVPLVTPVEERILRNLLTVAPTKGILVDVPGGGWSSVPADVSSDPEVRPIQLTNPSPAQAVELRLQLNPQQSEASTIVERAWVQSWVTPAVRQDRAVFRFVSDQRQIDLLMPAGVAMKDVMAWLDGKAVTLASAKPDRMTISLPEELAKESHLLEIEYRFAERPRLTAVSSEVPRLGGHAWVRRMYWQLVVPENRYLVWGPEGLAREYGWTWQGLGWARQSSVDQADLELWTAAPQRVSLPEGANRYVFSALGSVEGGRVVIADRTSLVGIASAAALILGLSLIYIPMLLRPGVLLATTIALVALGLLFADEALLLIQAASVGVALSFVAWMLRRGLLRQSGAALPPSHLLVAGSPSQTRLYRPVSDSSPSITSTQAAAVPSPGPNA